jgi:serine/threonine protein kinase
MATGKNPFGIKNHQELSKIVKDDFEMKRGSPELKSFITFILRKDPSHRPTGEVLLKHPFITKYGDI